jgi:uncharacterized membrane protein YeaQ/YmgE (transglycosylase-associated protein family)
VPRIAVIYLGVVAGLIAGVFIGFFVMNPLGSLPIYVVVLSGIVGGVVFGLLSKPLRKADDLSAIGVVLTCIAGLVGAFLTFCLGVEAFRLIDPNPGVNGSNWFLEEAFAFLCLGPLGGLFAILVTYKVLKKFALRTRHRNKEIA